MKDVPMSSTAQMLAANCLAYEHLVSRISAMDAVVDPESAIRSIQRGAWIASEFHPGRFADGSIENIALSIGTRLPSASSATSSPALSQSKRRVLHVTPNLTLGGHSRLIAHWIESDSHSEHSIALSASNSGPSDSLARAITASGGNLLLLGEEQSVCGRSQRLRAHAKQHADVVVWHQIGPDVVPVVAFAQPGGPPVVVIDHVDHMFWVGTSVADLVVNLRSVALVHTTKRRYARLTALLPIPLQDRQARLSRNLVRERLGVAPDRVMLLSVGREMKYRPCGAYDFLGTASRILDSHPNADLFVVGASEAGLKSWLRSPLHSRIHLLGSVDDPSSYHVAADVYLESFPYGSQTALLEAALAGLPVVPAYAPLFQLFVANDDALAHLLPNPASEDAFVELAASLIASAEQRERCGSALREALLREHVGDGWVRRVERIYALAGALQHAPGPIPLSPKESTNADIGMSEWRGDAARASMKETTDETLAIAVHRAVIARLVGDFTTARHRALAGLAKYPFHGELWRTLAMSLLGRHAQAAKRSCSRFVFRSAAPEHAVDRV
jgi:glycosyltransferase involved in cell wall biosynthesis